VKISTRTGSRPSGPAVRFDPAAAGNRLTVVLPDLDLLVTGAPGQPSFQFCYQ
jgi:hypothetical protein